jgi:hypothetical protein
VRCHPGAQRGGIDIKVIAFYLENRADLDQYVRACRAEIERQASQPSSGPSTAELRRRLETMRQVGTKKV